ncbi:hypothetical protein F4777DRAFT_23634 [Nemania sp. FL0916]|nr:hypothetical protein F4777DRAFT_23634 [Nemania sp. FL0916]
MDAYYEVWRPEDWYRHSCVQYSNNEGFPPVPKPPDRARSGAFMYDKENGFHAAGKISRSSVADMRLIFRKNASATRRAIATKQWITAQLRFYGIAFSRSADIDELYDTLAAAVAGRQCIEGGPPFLADVQKRLKSIYDRSWVEYRQAIEEHKIAVDEWHNRNFSKLNDPSAEVRYDIDAFFSKYFLDDKGLPAPDKTPEPIVLWDMNDWVSSLRRHVDATPGLHGKMTPFLVVIAWAQQLERGIDTAFRLIDRPDVKFHHPSLEACFDPDRFLAKYFLDDLRGEPAPEKQKEPLALKLWWDSGSDRGGSRARLIQAAKHLPDLLIQAAEIPAEDKRGNLSEPRTIVGWAKQVILQVEAWKLEIAQAEVDEAKKEKRDKEKAILAKVKPHIDYARAHRSPPTDPFTLSHLAGSYIMHCRQLQDGYRCDLGSMALDIHAPTSTHGAIAAFNFGLVEGTMLLAMSEESLERFREEQPVRESSSDEEESEYEWGYPPGTVKKRKPTSTGSVNKMSFKRRLGESSSKPGRVYLQWAGCETHNSYLVLDEDHERTGYFDLDKTGLTARGQFYYRRMFGKDTPLVFTLLKVADKPKKTPDAWSSYCERERWIHW